MKERPILFSGPMVRAILEGRKTQTRRILDPQPEDPPAGWYPDAYNKTLDWCFWGPRKTPDSGRCTLPLFRNKYGQTGDRLWVREAWCCKMEGGSFVYNENGDYACHYKADGVYVEAVDGDGFKRYNRKGYEASPWSPSIYMPRWASRITLEIESVRVERLQEISRQDAKAEGFWPSQYNGLESWNGQSYGSANHAFEACWKDINGPGSWDQNPWIWVIQFKRLEAK